MLFRSSATSISMVSRVLLATPFVTIDVAPPNPTTHGYEGVNGIAFDPDLEERRTQPRGMKMHRRPRGTRGQSVPDFLLTRVDKTECSMMFATTILSPHPTGGLPLRLPFYEGEGGEP